MPEGDSIYRFAATLRGVLEGQVIENAFSHGPGPAVRVEKIIGHRCTAVEAHGKNLFIHFEHGLSLRGHLRMYGTWHVYKTGQRWRFPNSDARLVLEVPGATVVNFFAPVIELLETRALGLHRPVAALGPDLLAEDFDEEEAFRRFRLPEHGGRFIGDAIMDQQIIAGVGNIWKHETLYRCGMYPWRKVKDIDDETLRGLISRARGLLLLSVGKSPDPRVPARRPSMFAYGRAGQPCRRCFTRMHGATQGADIRRTVWCSKCQPKRLGDADPPFESAERRVRRGG